MRAIWKGSISFGLVSIPVALHNASRVEELKFRLLRGSDLSPVNYKRVAQKDGREVPWDEIVKGYEYEKGKYVVLKDDDFKRVDLEATDTIDIVDFVALDEINPIYFYKPYYLEPLKGANGAYSLLRKVLSDTNKAGISKVIIRTRQHLAAVKCSGDLLALELMRFEDELVDPKAIKISHEKTPGAREVAMAKTLVDHMSEEWDPSRYTDDYRSALMKLIEKKVAAGGKELATKEKTSKKPTNVIDLASVLQQSLKEASGEKKKSGPTKKAKASAKKKPRKKAA
ncbi:MAG TPA: Ku protein [Opitutaceae bacterium]|nr:Ku protein [Opitutaceae bacterium]